MQKKYIKVRGIVKGYPFEFIKNAVIEITDSTITGIYEAGKEPLKDNEYIDFGNYIATPGFIQTHIHLCQTLFRGLADDLELLDWLNKRIFPLECAHSESSMRASAALGISELFRSGTTAIMDMGSINHEHTIIEEVEKSGLRAFLGKAMMDINDSCPKFKESTKDSIESSRELAKIIVDKNNPLLNYAFAPRFILSCSDELLYSAYELHKEFKNSLYHTHASENKGEMEAVFKRTGKRNIEAFNEMGLLSDRSCFAHCIWLNDEEINMMKESSSRVLHCPSSNLKLGSGIANIPGYLERGINVSIAADGAPCNNNLSVLTEMRHAALIQKIKSPVLMPALTVFQMATIDGAKALHIESQTGSLEKGKHADIVFWNFDNTGNSLLLENLESIVSNIVYSASANDIDSVMIGGKFVIKNRENLIFDDEKIISDGKSELIKTIERAGI